MYVASYAVLRVQADGFETADLDAIVRDQYSRLYGESEGEDLFKHYVENLLESPTYSEAFVLAGVDNMAVGRGLPAKGWKNYLAS